MTRSKAARKRRHKKRLRKRKIFKPRLPIAPPKQVHKTKKDYNRKEQKKVHDE